MRCVHTAKMQRSSLGSGTKYSRCPPHNTSEHTADELVRTQGVEPRGRPHICWYRRPRSRAPLQRRLLTAALSLKAAAWCR